jgi:hypothetical protein
MAGMGRGFHVTMDPTPTPEGTLMVHLRVKRWYMPIFLAKAMRDCGISLRYYPLVVWRHYTGRGVKHG